MLDSNRHLIDAGAALHLLHQRQKRPIGEAWSSAPKHTLEELQASYRKGNNIGLRTGEPSKIGDHYLHVIDLDVRDESLAREAHTAMLGLIPEAATMPTVISGSGGSSRHFYIVTDKPFLSRKLLKSEKNGAWEIELFGTNKQVAIPPSIHPSGKPYVWKNDWHPFYVNSEVIAEWGARSDDDLLGEGDDELRTILKMKPLDLTMEEIQHTLDDLPQPLWCVDYDKWLNVGMALHHQFEGRKEGYDLWTEFSKKVTKKWDERKPRKQEITWKSFGPKPRPYRFASLIQEAKLAREAADTSLFDGEVVDEAAEGERPARVSEREKRLLAFNEKHAIALIKGKTVILTFRPDTVDFGTVDSLHSWYENARQATERGTEPISKWWMRNPKRRSYYGGVVFRPGREVPADTLNLWRGFSFDPSPEGSCQRFLDHLLENICHRKQADHDYLIGWMAHLIQKPWEKPGVAVVFRGRRGVGKDVVAEHLGNLFKAHYCKISQMNHLTGTFNAHQEKALLIHVEEGLWAGDKKAEGPLKSLITSPTTMIEPKGINAFSVESCSRVLITSNEAWVVPATKDERRFAVYNVGSEHMQDRPYFKAMIDELKAGGYAKLLHYLKTYDLTGFDVGVAPDTEGLTDQKIATFKGVQAWWKERLEEGDLEDCRGLGEPWTKAYIRVIRDDTHSHWQSWWMDRRGFGHGPLLSKDGLGAALKDMCPSKKRSQPKEGSSDVFPPLAVCRAEFNAGQKTNIVWPGEGGSDYEETDIEDLL